MANTAVNQQPQRFRAPTRRIIHALERLLHDTTQHCPDELGQTVRWNVFPLYPPQGELPHFRISATVLDRCTDYVREVHWTFERDDEGVHASHWRLICKPAGSYYTSTARSSTPFATALGRPVFGLKASCIRDAPTSLASDAQTPQYAREFSRFELVDADGPLTQLSRKEWSALQELNKGGNPAHAVRARLVDLFTKKSPLRKNLSRARTDPTRAYTLLEQLNIFRNRIIGYDELNEWIFGTRHYTPGSTHKLAEQARLLLDTPVSSSTGIQLHAIAGEGYCLLDPSSLRRTPSAPITVVKSCRAVGTSSGWKIATPLLFHVARLFAERPNTIISEQQLSESIHTTGLASPGTAISTVVHLFREFIGPVADTFFFNVPKRGYVVIVPSSLHYVSIDAIHVAKQLPFIFVDNGVVRMSEAAHSLAVVLAEHRGVFIPNETLMSAAGVTTTAQLRKTLQTMRTQLGWTGASLVRSVNNAGLILLSSTDAARTSQELAAARASAREIRIARADPVAPGFRAIGSELPKRYVILRFPHGAELVGDLVSGDLHYGDAPAPSLHPEDVAVLRELCRTSGYVPTAQLAEVVYTHRRNHQQDPRITTQDITTVADSVARIRAATSAFLGTNELIVSGQAGFRARGTLVSQTTNGSVTFALEAPNKPFSYPTNLSLPVTHPPNTRVLAIDAGSVLAVALSVDDSQHRIFVGDRPLRRSSRWRVVVLDILRNHTNGSSRWVSTSALNRKLAELGITSETVSDKSTRSSMGRLRADLTEAGFPYLHSNSGSGGSETGYWLEDPNETKHRWERAAVVARRTVRGDAIELRADWTHRRVWVNQDEIQLSPRLFDLLQQLYEQFETDELGWVTPTAFERDSRGMTEKNLQQLAFRLQRALRDFRSCIIASKHHGVRFSPGG